MEPKNDEDGTPEPSSGGNNANEFPHLLPPNYLPPAAASSSGPAAAMNNNLGASGGGNTLGSSSGMNVKNDMQHNQMMNIPNANNTTMNSNMANNNMVATQAPTIFSTTAESSEQQQPQRSNNRMNPTPEVHQHHHPDLPFLITHWLSQYNTLPNNNNDNSNNVQAVGNVGRNSAAEDQQRKLEAVKQIHEGSIKLANAFQALGAYGSSSFGSSGNVASSAFGGGLFGGGLSLGETAGSLSATQHKNDGLRPTSYSDLSRKYSTLLSMPSSTANSSHVVGESSSSGGTTLLDALLSNYCSGNVAPSNNNKGTEEEKNDGIVTGSMLDAAYEASTGKKSSVEEAGSGRRVGDANSSEEMNTEESKEEGMLSGSAMMTMQAIISTQCHIDSADAATLSHNRRHHLKKRMELNDKRNELEGVVSALLNQSAKQQGLQWQQGLQQQLPDNAEVTFVPPPHERVVAQLQQRAASSNAVYHRAKDSVVKFKAEMMAEEVSFCRKNDLSSICAMRVAIGGSNLLGVGRGGSGGSAHGKNFTSPQLTQQRHSLPISLHRQQQFGRNSHHLESTTQLSKLKSSLSHAITISAHLIYPVYCLKFDKTGKYFITGADDQVVKLFHMGIGPPKHYADSNTNNNVSSFSSFSYGGNVRGAVLVCTLRGHAGVVTDIDVSSDNGLLATASADGDVRIWKLRDGRPVTLLRGHRNGANMVSWSTLSPYRLVTCGEDGLAKMWDVRRAVSSQGRGDFEGAVEWRDKRPDVEVLEQPQQPPVVQPVAQQPPPVAQQQPAAHGENAAFDAAQAAIDAAAAPPEGGPPPPLIIPPALPEDRHGDFVANNRLHPGVTLLAQLQHGKLLQDEDSNELQGRVTRMGPGRVVKVMCIARCPVGGHFATGSDDGIGRVWADDDDLRVERRDGQSSEYDVEDRSVAAHPDRRGKLDLHSNAPSTERLLATLKHHTNPVTDMKYSNAGDRILTASMKDGALCIWSWQKEGTMTSGTISTSSSAFASSSVPASPSSHSSSNKFTGISQLVIQLSPLSGGGPSTAKVHCDGAAWTCDDARVVTAQSSPSKSMMTSEIEIIPDSHMIYVWDSYTGRCLLGIMSSHTSLSSALAPHPKLPSVFASAGADGDINVWDLDRGDCFFTYKNTLLHGPIEPPTNRGRTSGYLEVQFSPDGLTLVATDENGRVTMLDTKEHANTRIPEAWMTTQYFANDYYELVWDADGRCIEKGSRQPPHYAPGGERCSHEGVAYSEELRRTYRRLEGPLALPQRNTRWLRDDVRARGIEVRGEGGVIGRSGEVRNFTKRTVRGPPDLAAKSDSLAIITKQGALVKYERKKLSLSSSAASGTNAARRNAGSASSSRVSNLSDRFEWRDAYADDLVNDQDDDDDNDEEFSPGRRLDGENSDDEDDFGSQRRRRRGGGGGGGGGRSGRRRRGETLPSDDEQRPVRASSRRAAQREYEELASEDDELEEMMTTHTQPKHHHYGDALNDWQVSDHIFKMPRGDGDRVHRMWLSRTAENNYLGQGTYCPQVGDRVVYIPRAHHETLRKFPVAGISNPWESWPQSSSWPVVSCRVTRVRYRFPYATYYKARRAEEKLKGVAAILTLEIIGVPSQTSGRAHAWPAPTFVDPPDTRTRANESMEFEVTLFKCNEEDFLIPQYLYTWRVKELERAIALNGGDVNGLAVSVYCTSDFDDTEDADHDKFTGRLVSTREESEGELHFMDSGYYALALKWDMNDEGSEDSDDNAGLATFSVWDINVADPLHDISAPVMDQGAVNAVKKAVHDVKRMDPQIHDWFHDLTDTRVYTDYLDMIEVPMHLSIIIRRLRSNYYTNKLSVVSDMELIKENAYKYNEDDNEMYSVACRMYDDFVSLLEDIEEPEIEEEVDEGYDVEVVPAKAGAKAGGSDEDEDSSEGEESRPQSKIKARATRKPRSDEVGVETESQGVAPRRSRRSNQQPAEEEEEEVDERRASSRARGAKPSYEEQDSDQGEESSVVDEIDSSEEDGEEEEEEEEQEASRPRRASSRARGKSSLEEQAIEEEGERPSKRQRVSRGRAKPVYTERDSEEEEAYSDAGSESEDEEEEVGGNKRKRGGRKGYLSLPVLEPWHTISSRRIRKVGLEVINRMRELDYDNLFAAPVLETNPDLENAYLRVVNNPMDFRTIENERLDTYTDITELQNDLILTFHNCCLFNKDQGFYDYAVNLWQQLNDVFDEVCSKAY